jgi:hypothetical protein
VVFDRVDTQPNDLGVAAVKLRLEFRHIAKFRGADRREVLGMRKQDRPGVPDPFMKTDAAFGGVSFEIGGGVAKLQGHWTSSGSLLWIAGTITPSLLRPHVVSCAQGIKSTLFVNKQKPCHRADLALFPGMARVETITAIRLSDSAGISHGMLHVKRHCPAVAAKHS